MVAVQQYGGQHVLCCFQIPCDRIIKSGDPKKVICDEVTIREATALVMGTRGLDPVHR